MTNGVIRGVRDSIFANNEVWDGTPKETIIEVEVGAYAGIKIEFLALEFPLNLFELSYRYTIDIPWL